MLDQHTLDTLNSWHKKTYQKTLLSIFVQLTYKHGILVSKAVSAIAYGGKYIVSKELIHLFLVKCQIWRAQLCLSAAQVVCCRDSMCQVRHKERTIGSGLGSQTAVYLFYINCCASWPPHTRAAKLCLMSLQTSSEAVFSLIFPFLIKIALYIVRVEGEKQSPDYKRAKHMRKNDRFIDSCFSSQ